MDEDYETEGNEDDNDDDDSDDEFLGFDNDMYYIPNQDVTRSQSNACNDRVKYSMRCHDSIDI